MKVCKYASMQVCKYSSMQVCTYASVQVCKYASMQIYTCIYKKINKKRKKEPVYYILAWEIFEKMNVTCKKKIPLKNAPDLTSKFFCPCLSRVPL